MKQTVLIAALLISGLCSAQSVIQSVNSGSVISANAVVGVGEIVVVPQNQNQSATGIIGVLAQVNQQMLEVPSYELSDKITVWPNPTVAKISFETNENLANATVAVFNNVGQLVLERKIGADNSIDLTDLAQGIYMIQLSNQKQAFKIIKH
ncbi:T9SS type A sorting domain-containing protein [Flavobacterium pallidum]|nr:T9SS type A sorting domain-containing protein [Flavobacterium pallidum]